MATVIIIGGTASTGKSTIGTRVAERFSCQYVEGDMLHPQVNIDKMANNIPLEDEDRWGWLTQVAKQSTAAALENEGKRAVVSCSALKKIYRDYVQKQCPDTKFLYLFLHASREELIKRAQLRQGHYMKSTMIDSQLAILELPTDDPNALCIDVEGREVDSIVEEGVQFVKKH
ncbi:CYFA0S23e00760g1_1 [Cyberlindnera fabianii]|uniref:Gluconokinase n=1 Tax=Cyberlindnera fabianii TaxID=36022 RepID=A0A061B913_CYBFA|nr:CYFA0S23e00760g1_1 [Cyberlindnera fabianii]